MPVWRVVLQDNTRNEIEADACVTRHGVMTFWRWDERPHEILHLDERVVHSIQRAAA